MFHFLYFEYHSNLNHQKIYAFLFHLNFYLPHLSTGFSFKNFLIKSKLESLRLQVKKYRSMEEIKKEEKKKIVKMIMKKVKVNLLVMMILM